MTILPTDKEVQEIIYLSKIKENHPELKEISQKIRELSKQRELLDEQIVKLEIQEGKLLTEITGNSKYDVSCYYEL